MLSEHFEELLQTYEAWLPRAASAFASNSRLEKLRDNVMCAAWTLRRLFAHSQAWKGFSSPVLIRVVTISLQMFALVGSYRVDLD